MKGRLVVFLVAMALWAAGISARLYEVQVVGHERYRERAERQQLSVIELSPPRGTIFDAKGRKLAVSAVVDSAYIQPRRIHDAEESARRIAGVLGLAPSEVRARLTDDRGWLWLARQLNPSTAAALRELEIDGVGFVPENKRFYPLGGLAAPVLGFVGTDHTGLAGVEAAYDQVVSGAPVRRQMVRDALNGTVAAPGFSFIDAEPGADLYLTLDSTIQHIVESELARALSETRAKSGVAILMDPASGAIRAMASLPAFDPNRFGDFEPARWRNRAIEDAYEPGSTFKAVTAAAALERNLIDPMDVIDCEEGGITLGSTRIGDHKPFADLTFRDVIAQSSNVGAIKTGLLLEREDFAARARLFGFGQETGVDLPGESSGIFRAVADWSRHEAAYLSIGQGISATPLQVIRSFAAMANGGTMVKPHIVAAFGRAGRRESRTSAEVDSLARVATSGTLRSLNRLLEAVVEEGTGTAAGVAGYRVAGKTGTAQKAGGRGYLEDRFVASFAGFVPSRDPKLVGLVVLDEPEGLFHGGEVAAPVFGAIAARVLPYLGIAPTHALPADRSGDQGRLVAEHGRDDEASLLRRDPRNEPVRASLSDAIPEVLGLTAREATKQLASSGLAPRLHGSGFVHSQVPSAGAPIAGANGVVELWLQPGAGSR